jgi:hypothetical protein
MMGAQRVAELRFQGKRKTNSITHPHGGAVSLAALEPEVCHDPNERGVLKGGVFTATVLPKMVYTPSPDERP